jgi:hypothetical protein
MSPGTSENILLMLLAIGMPIWTYFEQKRAQLQWQWTKTSGIVTRNETVTDAETKPVIQYSYLANGQHYSGTRIRTGRVYLLTRGMQREVLKDFPLHSVVDVFYDPLNPSHSVLKPGGNARSLPTAIGGGLLFFGSNLLILWNSLHS